MKRHALLMFVAGLLVAPSAFADSAADDQGWRDRADVVLHDMATAPAEKVVDAVKAAAAGVSAAMSAPLPIDYHDVQTGAGRISVHSLDAPDRMTPLTAVCMGGASEVADQSCDRVLKEQRKMTEGEFAISQTVAFGGGAVYTRDDLHSYAAVSWRADDNVTLRMRSNLTQFATVQAQITW